MPNRNRGPRSSSPSRAYGGHGCRSTSAMNTAPEGTLNMWEPVATPRSPTMRPQLLLPQMPSLVPAILPHQPSNYPLIFTNPDPPTLAPTEPVFTSTGDIHCWFGSTCGCDLYSTSARDIQQHLAQCHTVDVNMRDRHALICCQWWTTRGRCGHEVVCEMLGQHIVDVHLKNVGHTCPRCGRAFSRRDVLARHLTLHLPISGRQ